MRISSEPPGPAPSPDLGAGSSHRYANAKDDEPARYGQRYDRLLPRGAYNAKQEGGGGEDEPHSTLARQGDIAPSALPFCAPSRAALARLFPCALPGGADL